MPIDKLPAVRKIIEATGGITLAREQVLALLARPMFAAETEKTRYYLCEFCLHGTDNRDSALSLLTAVAHSRA